jgi:hypothetical protein
MDSIKYILFYEEERKVLQLFDGMSKCKEKLTYSSLPSKELSWKMIYLSEKRPFNVTGVAAGEHFYQEGQRL